MKQKLVGYAAGFLFLNALLAGVGIFLNVTSTGDDARNVLPLDKTFCVEICLKELQGRAVFPDFQEAVKRCDFMFGGTDTCELSSQRVK